MQTAATCDYNASGTSKSRGSACPCLQHNTPAPGSSSGVIKRAPSWPQPKAIRPATERPVGTNRFGIGAPGVDLYFRLVDRSFLQSSIIILVGLTPVCPTFRAARETHEVFSPGSAAPLVCFHRHSCFERECSRDFCSAARDAGHKRRSR